MCVHVLVCHPLLSYNNWLSKRFNVSGWYCTLRNVERCLLLPQSGTRPWRIFTVTAQRRPEQHKSVAGRRAPSTPTKFRKSSVAANSISRSFLGLKPSDKFLAKIWCCCSSTHREGGSGSWANFWVLPCCPLWRHKVHVWATRERVVCFYWGSGAALQTRFLKIFFFFLFKCSDTPVLVRRIQQRTKFSPSPMIGIFNICAASSEHWLLLPKSQVVLRLQRLFLLLLFLFSQPQIASCSSVRLLLSS